LDLNLIKEAVWIEAFFNSLSAMDGHDRPLKN
jgi:hypothetical protein